MVGVRRWARWEFSRRLEVTPFIRFITIERFVKGALLVLGGLVLIVAGDRANLRDLAQRLQVELNYEPGRHLWKRLGAVLLDRFGRHPDAIGVGAILYGLLELFEGYGLVLRRRWAEYLVLIATAALLPVEVTEVVSHFTTLKALGLLVNLAIVAYLIWRKRLFLERPSDPPGDPA